MWGVILVFCDSIKVSIFFFVNQIKVFEFHWYDYRGHWALHWRHNDHGGVSNHQPRGCLLNCLFRRRWKKTSKLCVTGLRVGNSPRPVNSPHKGPVTRKMFPFDDVITVWHFVLKFFWKDNWDDSVWSDCRLSITVYYHCACIRLILAQKNLWEILFWTTSNTQISGLSILVIYFQHRAIGTAWPWRDVSS